MTHQDKTLLIYTNNHFDPTWRRAWQRRFTDEGKTFASYGDLESWYMLDNMALAREHPDYKFDAESTIVVRTFLERHPEHREELVSLAREGRFGVTGGGDNIVDSNMVLGESLVRNYLLGQRWLEETFGALPKMGVRNDAFGNSAQLPQILRGCELTWVTGMTYSPAKGTYWRGLDGSTIVHRGPPIAAYGGGNTKYPPCPTCRGTGEVEGAQCTTCAGRGIEPVERARLPSRINDLAFEVSDTALVVMAPEELLPNPEIIEWADAQRDDYAVAFAIADDLEPYVEPWLAQIDAPPEDEVHPDVELNPNNSGCWVTRIKTKQTVRRQEYALQAAETLAMMAALGTSQHGHMSTPQREQVGTPQREQMGTPQREQVGTPQFGPVSPPCPLNDIWRKLLFTMFHDAITATHVDPAYTELQEIWDEIDTATAAVREVGLAQLRKQANSSDTRVGSTADDVITVLNLRPESASGLCTVRLPASSTPPGLTDAQGEPVTLVAQTQEETGEWRLRFLAAEVPGFGTRGYHVTTDAELRVEREGPPASPLILENARLRVEADDRGLLSVFDKSLGQTIAQTRTYRPAELVLEHDEGSPWATLNPDRPRIGLSDYTQLATVERGEGFGRLIYDVRTPRGMGFAGTKLVARVTLTLVDGLDRLDIHVDAEWDAFNHRVRLAMPMPFGGRHVYEIPYGMLERKPYTPTYDWAGANGDWPAINWAGVEGPDASVAVLNQGLPSYCIEPDILNTSSPRPSSATLFVSLLRSPTIPTYLHEPQFYTMTAWDGMRDAGEHSFNLALTAYATPFSTSSVVADGEVFNAEMLTVAGRVELPELPSVNSTVARAAAIKWAESGAALILRLQEFCGEGGEAVVTLPFPVTAAAKVNLLERRPEAVPIKDDTVRVTLRPWEIVTLRLDL